MKFDLVLGLWSLDFASALTLSPKPQDLKRGNFMANLDVDALLTFATQQNVSDVFFKEDAPPVLRLNGSIRKLDMPPLTPQDLDEIAQHVMPPKRWQEFLEHPDHDCAYVLPGIARFRVNVYRQRGSVALCLRIVQLKIRTFQELGLPEVIA